MILYSQGQIQGLMTKRPAKKIGYRWTVKNYFFEVVATLKFGQKFGR